MYKRVNLFCGHYGSGKTNIAINFAKMLKLQGKEVSLADLDIVNPYFRSTDSFDELKELGIGVIGLPFANSNVDLPSLPSETYSLVQNTSRFAVLDIGGDERGAYALGRFVPYILQEDNYEMFFVVNFYRPLTQTADEAFEVMKEIEMACGLKFSSIINNSNLGSETTVEAVLKTSEQADKLSEISGLSVCFTSAEKNIANEKMFPLTLQKRIFENQ